MSEAVENRDILLTAIRNTVVEVMGTMAWSEVGFIGGEESDLFSLANEVGGLVRLYGSREGMVGIAANAALAREIVSRITGLPVDELTEEDLLDGVAELANMVCGGMKTKAKVSDIMLSPPVAIVGREYTAQWKTDHSTSILNFQLEDHVFQVFVCI